MSARLARRNYGRGHGYTIDGKKVIGVTTVLNALSKPALTSWAARMAADEAVNNWERLAELPPMERHHRIAQAHRNYTKKAALRGTDIHVLGDKVAHGIEVDVPEEHRTEVEAYARFLDRWDVTTIATETPVASLSRAYAGTADLWCTVGKLGGARVLLDTKTGKGVYAETALQLAAYRYADVWQPNGKDSEEPLPPVDAVYVAHVLHDDVEMLPVTADERVFRIFLYAQQIAIENDRWKSGETLIGGAVTPTSAQEG